MKQKNHMKKMIAPIIITILIALYYIGIAVFFMVVQGIPILFKVCVIGISLLLTAVMVAVFVSRIKEIQGGEEDDLSQY